MRRLILLLVETGTVSEFNNPHNLDKELKKKKKYIYISYMLDSQKKML